MEINHTIFSKENVSFMESMIKLLNIFAGLGCWVPRREEGPLEPSLYPPGAGQCQAFLPYLLPLRGGCCGEGLARLRPLSSESRRVQVGLIRGNNTCIWGYAANSTVRYI